MRSVARWFGEGLRRARLSVRRQLKTPEPDLAICIDLLGVDPWLVEMLAPSARINECDPDLTILGPERDMPILSRTSTSTPSCRFPEPLAVFVQPRLTNPLAFRPPTGLPLPFLDLAQHAARRCDHPQNTPETAARCHEDYRSAHSTSANLLIRSIASKVAPQIDIPIDDDVTVMCITNRPHQLSNVIANYQRQTHRRRALLLVTNSDEFDLAAVEDALAHLPAASLLAMPERATLGDCLNEAVSASQTRFAAKFDDDDQYGAHYLGDMLIAHGFAQAGVVGKHTYYAKFPTSGANMLRFPGHEFVHTSFVAGGTLNIDLRATAGIRFRSLTIGEDSAFLRDCRNQGVDVFSADRFNYLQNRGADNTWQVGQEAFMRDSELVSLQEIETGVWV